MYKIEFLDSDKEFKESEIVFDSYEEALKWGRENLSNFLVDMIKIL